MGLRVSMGSELWCRARYSTENPGSAGFQNLDEVMRETMSISLNYMAERILSEVLTTADKKIEHERNSS